MDKREEKTIERIKDAFKRLIMEKNYKEITVQDILDYGDCGRATFYSHFKDKDEVLKSITSDIFLHIENPYHEKSHDFVSDYDFLHKIMHMLHHFREDKTLLNAILDSEGKEIFLDSLRRHLHKMIKENMMPYYMADKIPDGLLLCHLSSSLMEIVLWWITKDGCMETPEDITYYYFSLIMPSLKERQI